jgi:hypothetical protein
MITAALLCALYVVFAFQLHRSFAMKIVPALLGLFALASLRLRGETRLSLALVALPFFVILHGFGFTMARLKISPSAAAAKAGRPYDSRSKWEVVTDLRAAGVDAITVVQPKSVILTVGTVRVGDADVLPLGGVADVNTIYCNEGGTYTIYDADERGFSNPKGLWSSPADVAVIGDSYTQGACVPPDQSFVARLRERRPRTVNLGMGGNGPLLELAALREYLPLLRPKVVLWSYFRNDLPDLSVEKGVPLLMRYLDPGFSQGLAGKQAGIDTALRAMINRLGPEAPRWPSWLASIGLSRTSTPVGLQDLIMGEDSSVAGSILRLDPLAAIVDARSGAAGEPPDFELFGRVLARARADVEALGGKMYFVYIADMYAIGKVAKLHPLRDRVLETARAAGLPIIDTSPAFQAITDLESIRYNPTSHCSPGGYSLLAKVIGEQLDAQP